MRVGDYYIGRGGVYNVPKAEFKRLEAQNKAREAREKRSAANEVTKSIVKGVFSRQAQGIKDWVDATNAFENILSPNNTNLIRVYRDIEIDSHLWALMRTILLKTLATSFNVHNAAGEIDEELTKKIRQKWFRRFSTYVIESDFYGFSAIQLLDIIGDCFSGCELIPRQYVIQQRGGIKKSLNNSKDLLPFDAFENWLIPVGERENLGLLHKAAPLVIKKKEVISAWSESAEIFGMPMRIGRTNINSPKHRENMEDMLENLGSAAWAVMDKEDEIELVEGAKTDFYKIYDEFINRVNSELSKLILLQTGTTDEKAFVGSAEVHEGILENVIQTYVQMIEEVVKDQLIPVMEYHGLLPYGCTIKAEGKQKLSIKELFDIVKELLPSFNVSKEWIGEVFGVQFEDEVEDLNKNGEEQAKLRASVGGVTALIELQAAVSAGSTSKEAAIAIVMEIYGFDQAKAAAMIGDPKPITETDKTEKPEEGDEPTTVMTKVKNLYKDVLKTCSH